MAGVSLHKNPEEMTTEFAEEPGTAGCDNTASLATSIVFAPSSLQKNPKERGVTTSMDP